MSDHTDTRNLSEPRRKADAAFQIDLEDYIERFKAGVEKAVAESDKQSQANKPKE